MSGPTAPVPTGGSRSDAVGDSRDAWHEPLPHTADAGFRVLAADLPGLFAEAAVALAEIASEREPGAPAVLWRDVALSAPDLPALAFAWLNELISVADAEGGAVVAADVIDVAGADVGRPRGEARLRARVGLRPYAEGGVRALREPKSATYHGLAVAGSPGGGWELRAFVDL